MAYIPDFHLGWMEEPASLKDYFSSFGACQHGVAMISAHTSARVRYRWHEALTFTCLLISASAV